MNSTKHQAQDSFLLFCLLKPNHHTLFKTVDRFLNKSELGLTPPLLLPPRIKKLSSTAPNPTKVTRDYQDPTISHVLT